jgi:hypothetical protein
MGAPDVLEHLSALGVRLRRDGDALIAEPRSALTDDARAMIRAHKAELLRALPGDGGDVDEDYTTADLAKMDDLLRQLAELEGWPAERLTACLDERRRMAPVNVMPTVRSLQAAVTAAMAVWPNKPAWQASIRLCHLH